MIRFAVAIFLSSYLLFQVQPMIARYILPWFGGGPAVWTACMLFFQVALLGGYAYAHLLSARLSRRRQYILHVALLALSLASLPITPSVSWRPSAAQDPNLQILLLLAFSVGFPYIMVSSTAPLLQRWFSLANPGRSPYRLYALSNVGSLLGLLTYPFAVEPNLGLGTQTALWSGGYALFALTCAWAGRFLLSDRSDRSDVPALKQPDAETVSAPSSQVRLLWLALPACASLMLVAITNHVCQDVAVVPFLWVLPLSLYLLSFILCFDGERWYDRRVWIPLLAVALFSSPWLLEGDLDLVPLVGCFMALLFACCMVCHGELVRLRPPAAKLTSFYLATSAGGALGGLFVTLIAPAIFVGYWELHLGLAVTFTLAAWSLARDARAKGVRLGPSWAPAVVILGGLGVMVLALRENITDFYDETIAASRSFYGILRVREDADVSEARRRRRIYHGGIKHGVQYVSPQLRRLNVSYYSAGSGLSVAIKYHPKRLDHRSLHIGVVGLGAGAIAGHAVEGDRVRFYEIDPDVEKFAHQYFTYLADSMGRVKIVLGDARLSMERELETGDRQEFDVLALDAFSGDAIPIHLLTLEALELYWKHLRPDGVLVVHISNLNLELWPVVKAGARATGKDIIYIKNLKKRSAGISRATWVLLSNNRELLEHPQVRERIWKTPSGWDKEILWTDDHANLFEVLE